MLFWKKICASICLALLFSAYVSVLAIPAVAAAKAAPAEAQSAKPDAVQPVEPGTKPAEPTKAPAAAPRKTLDIVATAYAPGPHDNEQWGDKTYLGTTVRPGVIAVDPRIIPLGSHVYIQFPDGHGTYAVAEDTGGAIKGNRIDVAMWSVAEAYRFGIQRVKVSVLD